MLAYYLFFHNNGSYCAARFVRFIFTALFHSFVGLVSPVRAHRTSTLFSFALVSSHSLYQLSHSVTHLSLSSLSLVCFQTLHRLLLEMLVFHAVASQAFVPEETLKSQNKTFLLPQGKSEVCMCS